MPSKVLLSDIERLRLKMDRLANSGAGYDRVLEISQQLDKLIVMYYQEATRKA